MPTFLSPAVFANEIDLSALPTGLTGIVPAFIGTAQKGELNEPKLITNSQQFIDEFGEPFPESNLGYAVLAYLEEGNIAWVMRVGVECEDGQDEALADICIDTTGLKEHGWGRISIFKGIDFGKITTREEDDGFVFHDSSETFIEFNDAIIDDGTDGPTSASLTFTGATYTGAIDDEFLVLITSAPDETGGSSIEGAGYSVIRSSDGAEIASGELEESTTTGTSEDVTLEDGVVFQVVVSAGVLDVNDSFRFSVAPDNKTFSFRVDRQSTGSVTEYTISDGSYTAEELADEIAGLSGFSSEDYVAIANDDGTLTFRTKVEGDTIQLVTTEAFALEVGLSLYIFDIPRSNLIGLNPSPFDINSSNNQATIQVIGQDETKEFTANIPVGFDVPVETIASAINASATVLGDTLLRAYGLTIPGGDKVLVVETTESHKFDQIKMLADGSHAQTLRFAEEVGIQFPYTENFRGFTDSRAVLPQGGEVTESTPLTCEQFANGDTSKAAQCTADSSYYENIVGWFVASSPGTWLEDYELDLELFEGDVRTGDVGPNRYTIRLTDDEGIVVMREDDVSFDPRDERYIGSILNPGTELGGVDGNEWIHWEERPDFLGSDPSTSEFELRNPASFFDREFSLLADGIPSDPLFSSELDRAVIGNPADETGIFRFSNPERFNISLLLIPGFTSGAVITTGLSVCTQRGDCLYIIDPPFGLNAQQVVDWHNGLLFSDLRVALDSSYGALYHPYVKVFDQFNGGEIFIPPSGHVSAVFARTDRVAESWFAPAGLNRGKLITALDLEVNHSRGERDFMYGFNNAVNPIVNLPQRGIHVFGQRTLQRKDSALDRVNVRMLLIAIKKALAGPNGLLNEFLFEQNDRITRALVEDAIDSFMSDIAARRGVTAWKTICDETNNTPQRIDRNELWVALLIKPVRAIEFINLNIGILRTDQSFANEEILAAVGVNTVTTP